MSAILIVEASVGQRRPCVIHPNVSLTASSAESASLVAEETKAGVRVSITEVASVLGLRSAGIAALLYFCL